MNAADFDPHEMARRGRIGAHAVLAKYDPLYLTSKARDTFRSSFEKQVDPDGILDPEERARRAEHARRAHYARLSRLAANKRSESARRRKERRAAA